MKKRATIFIAVLAITALLGPAAFAAPAADHDNWQVIKNAVREDARPARHRGEAKWFKIVITDRHSREENLKITLPLSLVEGLVKMADSRHFRCNDFDADGDIDVDIDFEEVLDLLKKSGPMSLVEIDGDDGTIKVWIE